MVSNFNVLQGAPGVRLIPQQLHPTARAGGLMLYPFNAIVSGLSPSMVALAPGAPTTAPGALTFSVTPGQAYLDGEISLVYKNIAPSQDSINFSGTPDASRLTYGFNNVDLFASPTRLVVPWTGAALPTQTGTGAGQICRLNGKPLAAGDIIAHCFDMASYLIVHDFYVVKAVAGANLTVAKFDPSFAPPTMEGRFRSWGNQMEKLVTERNFSITEEKRIFHKTMYPAHVNSNSHALFREPASLSVGMVRLFVHTLPVDITLDLASGSTTTTIDLDSAKLIADLLASAGAGEVVLRGKTPSSQAALGGTSRTFTINGNTITLVAAASTSVNQGAFEIVATDNPNLLTYCYSPAFTQLLPSGNRA